MRNFVVSHVTNARVNLTCRCAGILLPDREVRPKSISRCGGGVGSRRIGMVIRVSESA